MKKVLLDRSEWPEWVQVKDGCLVRDNDRYFFQFKYGGMNCTILPFPEFSTSKEIRFKGGGYEVVFLPSGVVNVYRVSRG